MEQTSVVVSKLPGAGELISRAWKTYISNWNAQVHVTLPLVYLGIAYLVMGLLIQFVSSGFAMITLLLGLFGWFLTLWIQMRVLVNALQLHDGKAPISVWPSASESDETWLLFFAIIMISIIQFFIVLGGYILLIIPGIYLSIALAFSILVRIDKGNMKFFKALGASRDLVKGRWWGTFWRKIAGGFVFGLPFAILSGAALIGFTVLTLSMQSGTSTSIDTNNAVQGIYQAFNYVIVALAVPLFATFNVTLYRALGERK